MNFIIALVTAAATYKMPHKNPVGVPINLDMDNGEIETVKLADIPINRGMMAIKRHCGNDREKFFSAALRCMALAAVYKDERCKQYVRDVPEDEQVWDVSAAIGHVAGVMPLDEDGEFDLDKFFVQAQEIKRTKHGEED